VRNPEHADCLALALHYVVGALVAALIAARILLPFELDRQGAWLVLVGVLLVGGGSGGLLQDKLWISDSYRVLPPDEPRHSISSRILLAASIVLGLLMMGIGIYLYGQS